MYNLQNVKIIKAKFDQTSVVIILLVVITSIVVYTWMGLLEFIQHFNNVAFDAISSFRLF